MFLNYYNGQSTEELKRIYEKVMDGLTIQVG
jgi:hypothetical protein